MFYCDHVRSRTHPSAVDLEWFVEKKIWAMLLELESYSYSISTKKQYGSAEIWIDYCIRKNKLNMLNDKVGIEKFGL